MLSALDRAALGFGLEPLETRRMLSTATVNSSHVLVITGTPGNDTIVLNKLSNGKVSISGIATQFTPGSGSGQFKTITVNAGAGNDLIQINNNVPYTASTIQGFSGNDTLTGGNGNDSLDGGADNDTLDGGGSGADILIGGSGVDLANYSYRTDNLVITLDGVANDGTRVGNSATSAEHDNVQTEEVITGSGNDSIVGSGGDDFLSGGAGGDTLIGGEGNDVLTGSAGLDSMLGGGGDDFIQAQNQDKDSLSGGLNDNGTHGLDFASIDGVDVPAVVQQAIKAQAQQAALLAAIKPAITSPPSTTSPSTLDTTYGENGDGIEVGPDIDWQSINAAAIDSQGRIIFVGTASRDTKGSEGEGYGTDMVVTRFNADGTPDTDFGDGGEEDIDFTSGTGYSSVSTDSGLGVAIGSDDSIVVVGSTFQDNVFNNASEFAIAKLDNNGDLDNSFGNGGLQTLNLTTDTSDPFNSFARDVAIQTDGNIVVAGGLHRINTQVTYDAPSEFSATDNPNGVWSYGYSAHEFTTVNTYDTPSQTAGGVDVWNSSDLFSSESTAPDVQHNGTGDEADTLHDGQLVLDPGFNGQFSHVTFTVPKTGTYNIGGEFDGNTDTTTTDVHVLVNGVSEFDGNIDVAGEQDSASFASDDDLQGLQLNAGDTVDFIVGYGSNQNFEGDQTALTADVTRIAAPDDQTMGVARFTPMGQLDTNFNLGQGFNSIDVGDSETVAAVALQSLPQDFGAQRIVVGGNNGEGNVVLARFNSDGTVDFDFGNNGGFTNQALEDNTIVNDIAVDANNQIYVAGVEGDIFSAIRPAAETSDPGAGENSVLASFDSNGGLIRETDGDSGTAYNGLTVDSNGKILAVGTDGDDYLVGRYNSNLSFDTTFASGPITTDLTPSGSEASFDDTALAVSVNTDNQIIVGGFSENDGDLMASSARYVGDTPSNPFDIENFVTDLNNPPPELQAILAPLTPGAIANIDSQPDANGNVNIDTNNPKGDVITITTVTAKDGKKNDDVNINGIHSFYDVGTTKSITINTDGGADVITADSTVKTTLIVYAGEGDDSITGGGGKNILFGQGGNDTINGGAAADALVGGAGSDHVNGNGGNDIVIGSANADTLNGGAGQDIVIAGSTSYDNDPGALSSLLAEWNSGDTRANKISHITNGTGANAPFKLNPTGGANATVVDDAIKDSLTGGADSDWFFYKKTGSKADAISDLASGEQATLL